MAEIANVLSIVAWAAVALTIPALIIAMAWTKVTTARCDTETTRNAIAAMSQQTAQLHELRMFDLRVKSNLEQAGTVLSEEYGRLAAKFDQIAEAADCRPEFVEARDLVREAQAELKGQSDYLISEVTSMVAIVEDAIGQNNATVADMVADNRARLRNGNGRGPKVGTLERVREAHRLIRQGKTRSWAFDHAHTDSRTYDQHCREATGEDPIEPYQD